jgi:hypothetical protein
MTGTSWPASKRSFKYGRSRFYAQPSSNGQLNGVNAPSGTQDGTSAPPPTDRSPDLTDPRDHAAFDEWAATTLTHGLLEGLAAISGWYVPKGNRSQ